jgi:septum formation protein
METLLLASSSPRRRELLESVGLRFETIVCDVDEGQRDDLAPRERVVALALDKARAGVAAALSAGRSEARLVLGADTLVCVGGEAGTGEIALGKPADRREAESMLRLLSGREHFVRSGLALVDRFSGEELTARSDSIVRFAALADEEIRSYLDTGEWEGVAGAYRIQGAAALLIERLEGSWSCVVGLPLRELYVILRKADFR